MNAHRTSTAVMARRVEPADSLDFFPTPPWATRAFCEHVLPVAWTSWDTFSADAIDPGCGEGHMALALEEYFPVCHASDIFDYGFGAVADFLHADYAPAVDWFVMNPPFNQALDFVQKALQLARRGVAMLIRIGFQEGEERYRDLYSRMPPQFIFQYAERVPMHRGRWVIDGKTATAYEWFVWLKVPGPIALQAGTRFRWIPKSRIALSKHDDWLKFSGCMDLPKEHAAMKLQVYREPVLTLAQVREEQERLAAERMQATPGSIADVRAAVMERLI